MSIKIFFAVVVLLMNSYSLVSWIIAFNKFSNHNERVKHFLEKSYFFNSVVTLNSFLLLATIASLAYINIGEQKQQAVRNLISVVHILFILYFFWGML